MSTLLEFTGERFTPECVREIWYEHFHRYALAARWCAGKRTLDAACGEGYGSALLARYALSVEGVDISEKAISHAKSRYGDLNNVDFNVADCTSLPFEDAEFERVVSFETLEHLEAHDQLMSEFRRVLKPDGVLIISTPDKAVYSDDQESVNEYHVKELYKQEFVSLIQRYFPVHQLLGQKLMFHSAIWSMDRLQDVAIDSFSGDQVSTSDQVTRAPMYYIALCAASESHLPEVNGSLSLFDDEKESVYQHYNDEVRRHIAAGGIIAELQKEIEHLKSQIEAQNPAKSSWWQRLLGKP